jgi:nucleolar protein 15
MEDDQTEALLKGFESDGDDDEEKNPEDKVYSGEEIPEITTKAKKKLAKLAEKKQIASEPGTVYLGRIPHGFYENEMKQYFKQFGDILNLRLSRNKKTGKSKHYAFIQFNSGEVAEIVSKTMDNYLLFGHILKCKVVPKEQVHDSLWEGANKRFKKVPWNKMEGRKLKQGATEETWDKRAKKEEKRRAAKQEKLKAIGYDFAAPDLKSAKDVQRAASQQLIVEAEVAEEKEPTPEPPKKVEAPKAKAAKAEKPKRKADEVETEEPSKKKVKAKGSSADLKAAAAAKSTAKVEKAEKKAEKPAKKAKKSKA